MLQCEGFIQLQLCDAVFLMIREGFIQVHTRVSLLEYHGVPQHHAAHAHLLPWLVVPLDVEAQAVIQHARPRVVGRTKQPGVGRRGRGRGSQGGRGG